MAGKFNCTGCGACCRRVGLALERGNVTKEQFPFGLKEDGMTCEKLADDGVTCTVYDRRPPICNVEKQWSKVFKKKKQGGKLMFPTKKQYYRWQAGFCVQLQEMCGDIPDELKMKPEQYN